MVDERNDSKGKEERKKSLLDMFSISDTVNADKRSSHTNNSVAQRPNLWLHSKLMSCERA